MKKSAMTASMIVFSFLSVFQVAAVGKKENVSRQVENIETWQETIDISGKKNGKYNILVTVNDVGGNTSVAGPFNIYIDPKSDLPVIGIANPTPDRIISGHLNIVGICFDDDAVDYVELIIDGKADAPVRAKGTDFWSYQLNTSGMTEGFHTIEAYGVDVSGVKGKPVKTRWNLNRAQPVATIDNVKLGELVSGVMKLKGSVTDGNGIKSLAYSLDAATYIPLKLYYDKKTKSSAFDLAIDTKPFADGPKILWFKAEDEAGSQSVYSWLFIIDNAEPDVKIVYPADGQPVNGVFSAAGYAKDAIGLAKLEWRLGKTLSGEFEVKAGDPYWVHTFDVSGFQDRSVNLVITATDVTGNVTKIQKTIPIDREADKPSLVIQSPAAGESLGGDLYLRGIAHDDDGVTEIVYSFNGGPEQSVKTDGVFCVPLTDLDKGLEAGSAYYFSVQAVDINGLRSDAVRIPLNSAGSAPSFEAPVIRIGKETPRVYEYGMSINPESGASLTCTARGGSKLVSLAWRIGDGVEKVIQAKSPQKDIVLSMDFKDAPWGVLPLYVKATDTSGREQSETFVFFVEDLSLPVDLGEEKKTIETMNPQEGARRLTIVAINGEPYTPGMAVRLPSDSGRGAAPSIIVRASGAAVSSVNAVLNSFAAKAEIKKSGEAQLFDIVIPLKNIPAGRLAFSVSAVIDKTEKAEIHGVAAVIRDKDPALINNKAMIYWFPESAIRISPDTSFAADVNTALRAYANVGAPQKAFVQSLDAGNKAALSVSLQGKVLSVSAKESGYYKNVKIVVVDSAGKEYAALPISLLIGSSIPRIAMDAMRSSGWVQNTVAVSGRAEDAGGIASVSWSLDSGASWKPCTLKTDGTFTIEASLAALPDGLVTLDIKAIAKGGGHGYARMAFNKDTTPPKAAVVVPENGDTVNGETTLVFKVEEAGRLFKAEYVPDKEDAALKVPLELEIGPLLSDRIGSPKRPLRSGTTYRFTDMAGNSSIINSYGFSTDTTTDLPVVEIGVPADGSFIRNDFEISGIAYDDDGLCKLFYSIDGGKFIELPDYVNSFSIPMKLSSMSDNEHRFTVYAQDVNGVKGKEVSIKFYVSREDPLGAITSPGLGEIIRGTINLSGTASDANGIEKVQLSFDNGNTYADATGTENWTYSLNTELFKDGSYVVFLKARDKYGMEGLYAYLINIDNTPPDVRLSLPEDGSSTSGRVFLSGRAADETGLVKLFVTLTSLSKGAVPAELSRVTLELNDVISKTIDISALPDGMYNMELTGVDLAGSTSRVSRNIKLDKSYQETRLDLMYPIDGEYVQGIFDLYGKVTSAEPAQKVSLFVDGALYAEAVPSHTGYFKITVTPSTMKQGKHVFHAQAVTASGAQFVSHKHTIQYNPYGPWVSIDNFTMGDFAFKRPWLKGRAGYEISEEDKQALVDKETAPEKKQSLYAKTVKRIELSFDNGKTFIDLGRKPNWKYRIENEDMAQGKHFILVRATMENGEIAVTRTLVAIDKTPPSIELIAPESGASFNEKLAFSGLSRDDNGLRDATVELRKGDKNLYKLPAFFQGLYIDAHFWGATVWGFGVGLSFFDDNVKLQFQYGQLSQKLYRTITGSEAELRYSGHVFGGKLLANLGVVPFRPFAGPDWEWLSMSFALGADFSWFSNSQSGKGQMLSAIVAQIEFPRVTFASAKYFRTLSLYTEGQLWFIPTDATSAGSGKIKNVELQISVGLRANVF